MIQDIQLVDTFRARELENALHVAYHGRVNDRVGGFLQQQTEADAVPAQLSRQLTAFSTAYTKEDEMYRLAAASTITQQLKTADDEEDSLLRQTRNIINLYATSDFDAEKQAAAKALQFSLRKYKIDPDEAYEKESTKILQWLQEVMSTDPELPKHAQKLGITQLIAKLQQAAMQVKNLIGQRNDERAIVDAAALKTARAACDTEYRMLVQVLNACALLDTTEKHYETLVRQLNQDITYYRNTILARQKPSSGDTTPDTDPQPDPDTDTPADTTPASDSTAAGDSVADSTTDNQQP